MVARAVADMSCGGLYHLIDEDDRPIEEPNEFLNALSHRGLSPRTIRAYAFDLVVIMRWLGGSGKKMRELRQSDLLEFIGNQKKDAAHPNSINRRLITCRLFYRFLVNAEIPSSPRMSLPAAHYKGRGRERDLGLHQIRSPSRLCLRLKTPRKIVEPLSREQVRTLLGTLRRYRDLAIVYLMLLCGLRSREVLALELGDISFDEQQLLVRGKGDKERMLPLPKIALQTLDEYIRLERPSKCVNRTLFVVLQGNRRGHPMTASGLRSLFRVRRRNRELANANAHRLRHTFGADMARAGVRLPILQRLMGHADGMMTLQYVNLSMSDIADEYHRAVCELRKRYKTQ